MEDASIAAIGTFSLGLITLLFKTFKDTKTINSIQEKAIDSKPKIDIIPKIDDKSSQLLASSKDINYAIESNQKVVASIQEHVSFLRDESIIEKELRNRVGDPYQSGINAIKTLAEQNESLKRINENYYKDNVKLTVLAEEKDNTIRILRERIETLELTIEEFENEHDYDEPEIKQSHHKGLGL